MMRQGFTGTQHGMTLQQMQVLRRVLKPGELHHGDCVGADAEAHDIAVMLGVGPVVHPPKNAYKRAWKRAATILAPLPYLARNRIIVESTEILIAAPASIQEQQRSGTWWTVRYARRIGRKVIVIAPDGSVFLESHGENPPDPPCDTANDAGGDEHNEQQPRAE